MAIKKEIEIVADTSQAVKSVKKLGDEIDNVSDKAEDAEKGIDDIGDSAKKQTTFVKGLGTAFKGVGLALKALGIGLIIALVAKLTDVFSKNQKVLDFFRTGAEALSIVFNDFFEFIFNNAGKVSGFFKDIFENPLENIKKFGDLIRENVIERFTSLLEVLGFVGTAFKKLFEGDFTGALDSVKEAGKELVDVFTGVDDSTTKIAAGFDKVTGAIRDYTVNTIAAASANIQLGNSAELAAAQQTRLVEQFDRLAEQQRQIRDDVSVSLKERQEANERLGEILEKQEEALLKQADLRIAAAQAQANVNNNIENQVALIDALAEKEGVLATIEGFRSEQLINKIGLKQEEIALDQTISDAEKERQLKQLEFEASLEENEVKKLQLQRERLEQQNTIIEEDLERKRELFKEGTQARVDAEQEYLNLKQEIDNQLLENDLATNTALKSSADKLATDKINQDKTVAAQKEDIETNLQQTILNIAKEGSAVAKGLAIANIVRDQVESVSKTISATTVANAKAVAASPLTAGQPFVAINTIQAAAGIAAGVTGAIKSIKAITSDAKNPQGGSAGAGGGGGGSAAPSFNLVAGSGTNQIAEGLSQQPTPIKAFVVSSEVTTAQSLNRNIEQNASF